jgi:hypothetical protein
MEVQRLKSRAKYFGTFTSSRVIYKCHWAACPSPLYRYNSRAAGLAGCDTLAGHQAAETMERQVHVTVSPLIIISRATSWALQRHTRPLPQ